MPDTQSTPPAGGQGFPPENSDGSPSLVGKDDYTKWEATQRLNKGNVTVLSGNYADLQRLGASAATGTVNVNNAVAAPPGYTLTDKNVVTPAQHEAARGEFTRETQRTGLVSAPVAPEPNVDNTPNPVDPGSQSPTVEAKKGEVKK